MIKSKKAKEIIETATKYQSDDYCDDKGNWYSDDTITVNLAIKAVEQVESELYSEEQCIEAFHIFMNSAFSEYGEASTYYKNRVRQFLSALKSLKQ